MTDTKPSKSFSSWGAAFESAAEIKPQDLGNFQPPVDAPDKPKWGAGNVLSVGAVAQESLKNQKSELKRKQKTASETDDDSVVKKKTKKSKKAKKKDKKKSKSKEASCNEPEEENTERTPVGTTETAPEPTLEGQMVFHQGESLLVLVDHSKKIVYSMDRSEIGTVVSGQITITGSEKKDTESDFPFPVAADDHCESPANSYKDIKAILDCLAPSKKSDLAIYDPYYCNGLVRENLKELGYPNVYNKKEDAYVTWDVADATQPYPSSDVFITNPPYSGDHPEKLIRHLTEHKVASKRPWCLLMPQYVHKKDYYKAILAKKNKQGIQPFYLVPKKRYVYLPPKNFREKKDSDVHKKSSPFVSMWYIWGGSVKKTEELMRAYKRSGKKNCEIAYTTSALRDLRRKGKRK